MPILKKLLALLTPPERKRAGVLMGMILMMAFIDMLGVASILPFMAVLANPEMIQTNAALNTAFTTSRHIGIYTPGQFLFALGVLVFILLVVSLAFKALTTYAQLRFTLMCEYSIGKRLVVGYLHQPYSWFLSRHSADLGKTILSEVNTVIFTALNPMMICIAQSAVVTALLTLLILIDPKLAIIVGLTLATAYALIFKATRGVLSRIGAERVKANQERFTVLSEAFGASKEVKFGGLEQTYIQRFSDLRPPSGYGADHQPTAALCSGSHRLWWHVVSGAVSHGAKRQFYERPAYHRAICLCRLSPYARPATDVWCGHSTALCCPGRRCPACRSYEPATCVLQPLPRCHRAKAGRYPERCLLPVPQCLAASVEKRKPDHIRQKHCGLCRLHRKR